MVAVERSSRSNEKIASMLWEIADHLQLQGASAYRVQAYERAAQTLGELPEPVEAIFRRDHLQGLIAIPTVGRSIARAIQQYLQTGRMSLLERLRGDDPAQHAADPRKVQLRFWSEPTESEAISIAELLSIDRQYREAAADGQSAVNVILHRSVMSIQQGPRHYTVHFSNSPRAQQFHATEDWVVIERDDQPRHTKWTVMTSHDGKLHGCRTVRGRDEECYEYYRAAARQAVEKYPMVWS